MIIKQKDLENYLWGSANILRGIIDAGDYKQYIFPLLFLKRICDVYDEEYEKALKDSDGDTKYAEFAENHRFQIPKNSHWDSIRITSRDIGIKIQKSMRVIEKANPDTLYGIFGDVQWTNKDRFSDRILKDLIEHFSSLKLTLENIPQDQLGEGYEYLIKKFADDSGHNAQEFYTNRTLVSLMAIMLNPKKGESIYDPTCGSGGMLLISALQVKNKGMEYRNLKLYGQEINLITSSIARMNLYLHGIEDFEILRGDTLANPLFIETDMLKQFDIILANPPYSIKSWNRKLWEKGPWGRNMYGLPPQGRADYAFFQHIIKSMHIKTGRCAILFPHGVLFRDEEKKMRHHILKDDKIECIIGLGPNLFYNSPMEACIIICKNIKPVKLKNKILFINAINDVKREDGKSFLEPHHIKKISNAYFKLEEIDGYSKIIDIEKIFENNSSLSIPLYIENILCADSREEKSVREIINQWMRYSKTLKQDFNEFFSYLEEER